MEPVSTLAKAEKITAIIANIFRTAYYAVKLKGHEWTQDVFEFISTFMS